MFRFLFSFDRKNCENSVEKAVSLLHERETAIREGELKDELKQLKVQYEQYCKAEKKAKDKPKTKYVLLFRGILIDLALRYA